jgi:hypothetical protein
MDFKDFKDGLISLSLILFIFSFSLLISAILLKPYFNLNSEERNILVIFGSINLFFSLIYLYFALRLEKVYKLENKNVEKYGKKIGIFTIFYIPHLILFCLTYFMNLHNLLLLIISLISLFEISIIIVVFKEVYDISLKDETLRNFEINADRKKYLEREDKLKF